MQSKVVERFKEVATHSADVTLHGIQDVAQETRREVSTLWQNADERDDLIRTGAICVGILIGVSLLVTLTGWLPVWLRVLVIFGTLGALARWFVSRISGDSD